LREAARAAGFPRSGFDVIFFATPATRDTHPNEVAKAMDALMGRFDKGHK